jgi:hypothetical protein
MIQDDPDADAISRERRAEYGAVIGWFATWALCPETDADRAVQLAKQKGRIAGIAGLYRNHKDAQNPEAAAAKEKAKATKVANTTQAKVLTSAAANTDDLTSDRTGVPTERKGSTESAYQAECSQSRSDLAEEFARKLDAAGAVPLLPGNRPDLGVSLYLAIYDQSTGQPRMFEITYTETGYRRLLDDIIQRVRDIRTAKSAEAA